MGDLVQEGWSVDQKVTLPMGRPGKFHSQCLTKSTSRRAKFRFMFWFIHYLSMTVGK